MLAVSIRENPDLKNPRTERANPFWEEHCTRDRETRMRWDPASASPCAIASPMPIEAPVSFHVSSVSQAMLATGPSYEQDNFPIQCFHLGFSAVKRRAIKFSICTGAGFRYTHELNRKWSSPRVQFLAA